MIVGDKIKFDYYGIIDGLSTHSSKVLYILGVVGFGEVSKKQLIENYNNLTEAGMSWLDRYTVRSWDSEVWSW